MADCSEAVKDYKSIVEVDHMINVGFAIYKGIAKQRKEIV